mmetsp:Transcript_7412/g.13710  ORF Transcript_7412/g.13710 Transcript_7412/m.13710 type:complete len:281 (-) Transcript_7412:432-1274(-)
MQALLFCRSLPLRHEPFLSFRLGGQSPFPPPLLDAPHDVALRVGLPVQVRGRAHACERSQRKGVDRIKRPHVRRARDEGALATLGVQASYNILQRSRASVAAKPATQDQAVYQAGPERRSIVQLHSRLGVLATGPNSIQDQVHIAHFRKLARGQGPVDAVDVSLLRLASSHLHHVVLSKGFPESHHNKRLGLSHLISYVQEHLTADVAETRQVIRKHLEPLEIIAPFSLKSDSIKGGISDILPREQVDAVAKGIECIHLVPKSGKASDKLAPPRQVRAEV